MMKRKLALMFFVLVLVVFAPVISIVSAGKSDRTPPTLEKHVFIHHKRGPARPPWAGGGGGKPEEDGQYKLLGKGVEWKTTPVTYVIDPDNNYGLSKEFVVAAIFAAAEEWDANTQEELFGDTYTIDHNSSWDDESPDGRNELLFGDYPQAGVIAVTIIWGYFSGPVGLREIIEFDILFDTDYTWGYAGETSETELGNTEVMDLQNIATHELGHGVGLADLYDSSASEETMYGYSAYGETWKRTVYTGDIAGIKDLYG